MRLGWAPPNDDDNDDNDDDMIVESDASDPVLDLDLFLPTDDVNDEDENETDYSSDSSVSCSAPPYSPLQPDTVLDQQDISIATDHSETSTGIDMCDTSTSTNQHATVTPNIESTAIVAANISSPGQLDLCNYEICSPGGDHDSEWYGYKVVIDNVDKNIYPSFQCFDNCTSSNHWIHGYAVLDRVDFSAYSELFPSSPMDVKCILINQKDVAQLEDDSIVLMSRYVYSTITFISFNLKYVLRILEEHMDEFSSGSKSAKPHILHKFTKEMSSKSEVVSIAEFFHFLY